MYISFALTDMVSSERSKSARGCYELRQTAFNGMDFAQNRRIFASFDLISTRFGGHPPV